MAISMAPSVVVGYRTFAKASKTSLKKGSISPLEVLEMLYMLSHA